jgi:hypothetical protein
MLAKVILFFLGVQQALSWWQYGHMLTAMIAYKTVDDSVLQQAETLN